MIRKVKLSCVAAMTACVLGLHGVAHGHGDVMRIGSTQAGGGQLQIESEFDFDLDVYLTELASGGGQTLYQAIIPSFSWILGANESGLLPLPDETRVTLVLNAVMPGASVRVGGRLLDAPQESATLGTFSSDPEAHIHPEWQLILPTGETGAFTLSFSLTTSTAGFTESPSYTLALTNIAPPATPTVTATVAVTAPPSPSPTATLSPTPTSPAAACAGDCDGDGTVTVDEIVRAVILALGEPGAVPCPAADTSMDGLITVDEIVGAIDSALQGCAS